MKILILSDVPSWIIDRITDEIMRIVPMDFQKGYYTQMTTKEIIKNGNKCDIVHYMNWDIDRHSGIIDGLSVPLIVSCRSHRFPDSFKMVAKSRKIILHVITPQLLQVFPWATYIPDGIFKEFVPDREFVVGFAASNNSQNLEYKGYGLIQQACKELGVILKPAFDLQPHQMIDYYRSIDLYVCASRNEGHSTPVMECLAMNKPVLTVDVGLASTFDVHKVERNVESIKRGIIKFYTHSQVRGHYWDNLRDSYLKLYNSVIPRKATVMASKQDIEISYWESHRGQESYFFSKYLLLLKHWDLPCSVGSVLDVGCGPLCGFLPHLIAEKKVGIEPLFGEYKRRGLISFDSGITLMEGHAESFFTEDKFDLILCADAIDHGDCTFDSIRNIVRSMKTGSTFCLHVHLRTREQLNEGHNHLMSLDELDKVTNECGLKNRMLKFFEECPYTGGKYKTLIGKWEL